VFAALPDGTAWIMKFASDIVHHFVDGRIHAQRLPPYSMSDSTRILNICADKNREWLGGSFGLAEGIGWIAADRYYTAILPFLWRFGDPDTIPFRASSVAANGCVTSAGDTGGVMRC